MADITLNSAVRSNLRTLQSTTDLMNRTEERLSTGKKVNSAFDNPGSFFTAQALDRRSSDLNGLLDSVSNSVKTLEAADNGITAITKVVESLKATARQALQAPKGAEYVISGTGGFSGTGGTVATAGTFSINGQDVTTTTADTASTVAAKINALDDAGVKAEVVSGQLKLTSDELVEIGGTAGAATAAGLTVDTTAQTAAGGQGQLTVTDLEAYNKRQGFLSDYNAALEQIDSLAKDASYNGVNLLANDDLEVTFNEDGSSKLDVKGTDFGAAGLGLTKLTESVAGSANAVTTTGGFDTKGGINDALDQIDAAFGKLESQSSKFGSQLSIVQTRQSFTKDMIGTLDDGSAALTSADTNAEAAALATLQTRQSLIVSALSISTSQESNVLQLLR